MATPAVPAIQGQMGVAKGGGSATSTTSVASTGGAASGGGGNPCGDVAPPSQPAAADDGDDVEFVVALSSLDFGESRDEDDPLIGHDMDLSGPGSLGPLCKAPAWPPWDPNLSPDDACGRDNGTSQLVNRLPVGGSLFKSKTIVKEIDEGNFSILFHVSKYNGKANDKEVRFAMYSSPGLAHDPCNPRGVAPRWDGNDEWPVSSRTLAGGDGGSGGGSPPQGGAGGDDCTPFAPGDDALAIHVDHKAHVANGKLVAAPEKGLFVIPGKVGVIHIELSAFSVVATINENGGA
jgi:hypothetical protein